MRSHWQFCMFVPLILSFGALKILYKAWGHIWCMNTPTIKGQQTLIPILRRLKQCKWCPAYWPWQMMIVQACVLNLAIQSVRNVRLMWNSCTHLQNTLTSAKASLQMKWRCNMLLWSPRTDSSLLQHKNKVPLSIKVRAAAGFVSLCRFLLCDSYSRSIH